MGRPSVVGLTPNPATASRVVGRPVCQRLMRVPLPVTGSLADLLSPLGVALSWVLSLIFLKRPSDE